MPKTKVLYVDDEDDIREVAAMSLELDPDFEIRTCASGPEALDTAPGWSPDLILLDVMMPGMDGPETLAALRSDTRTQGIPIVFITARTQTSEVARFMALGAAGVIAKPFEPMDLAALARSYLA